MCFFYFRFSNLFQVVDEGKQAAAAAATHPKFKLRWLRCLDGTAQENAIIAIKNEIAGCYNHPSQNVMEVNIDDDGFDFNNESLEHTSNYRSSNILGITACEIEFQRFCEERKIDLSI